MLTKILGLMITPLGRMGIKNHADIRRLATIEKDIRVHRIRPNKSLMEICDKLCQGMWFDKFTNDLLWVSFSNERDELIKSYCSLFEEVKIIRVCINNEKCFKIILDGCNPIFLNNELNVCDEATAVIFKHRKRIVDDWYNSSGMKVESVNKTVYRRGFNV